MEYCREEINSGDDFRKCLQPARYIIWGKLFPPEALGPRCQFHAVKYFPAYSPEVYQWAVYDLDRQAHV